MPRSSATTSRIKLVIDGCIAAGAGRKISNAATSASTSSMVRVSWLGLLMAEAYEAHHDAGSETFDEQQIGALAPADGHEARIRRVVLPPPIEFPATDSASNLR